MIKLDISKAFDSVSWAFLIEVLIRLGFGQIWCNVVCGLLSSSSTQILLNGCPGEVIYHRRGLRQGDPLSPMLFVLVMDVLNIMVQRASAEGVLQPLSSRFLHHRISLYADDVVVFLRSDVVDIEAFKGILHLFGEASGLKTNIQKSNVFPIHCDEEDLASVQASLPCQLSNFPCKYLGLLLSLKCLSRPQLQSIIDRIAVMLPGWKAELMSKAGQAVYIQSVITSRFVYLAMALDLPAWAIKAIDKLRRAFLWKGGEEIKGGHCSLAWSKVTRPKELGGLGLFDLKLFGWALRVRWLWLQKSDPGRPWAVFPLHFTKEVVCLFNSAVYTEIGNGLNTLFWTDKWLHGHCIQELAPAVFASIPRKVTKSRLVKDALTNLSWVQDV
jgi:hypothetical protein